MTEREFIFWLKGYLKSQSDSQMKIDIEEMVDKIKTHTTFQGTISEPYKETVKWANKNSDIWFNNKFGINGSADHLS